MKKCKKCLEMKQIFEFPKDKSLKEGVKNYCKRCDAKRKREKSLYTKEKIKEYLGGELICASCGYTYPTLTPFNFHHINPKEKEGIIAHMLDYRWEKIEEELNKCILLCANCHLIEHHE